MSDAWEMGGRFRAVYATCKFDWVRTADSEARERWRLISDCCMESKLRSVLPRLSIFEITVACRRVNRWKTRGSRQPRAVFLAHDVQRFGSGECSLIRSSGSQRIIDVGDLQNPRQQGDLVAAQSVGVSGAVPPLMVVTNDRQD